MKLFLRSLLLTALTSSGLFAQEQSSAPGSSSTIAPSSTDSPNLRVEMCCLVLPDAKAVPLIRLLRSSKPEEKAQASSMVDELLADGTAKIVGWPFLLAKSGLTATIEAAEEVRYASQFEQASTNYFLANDGTPSLSPNQIRGADSLAGASEFETRNVGVSLEIKPVLQPDGKSVTVGLTAAHVRLEAVDLIKIEHEFTPEKRSEKLTYEQPRFSSLKVKSELTVESGVQTLAGLFRVPKAEGQMELFILSIDVAPTFGQ